MSPPTCTYRSYADAARTATACWEHCQVSRRPPLSASRLHALCPEPADMGCACSDIAFKPALRAVPTRMGTRSVYAALDRTYDRRDALTADEGAFIHERDAFYQATVSESGWP